MTAAAPKKSCATCRRAVERAGNAYFPFCSERCQMADLGRWLSEDYRVPDESTPVDAPPPTPTDD